jgi:hypothetical protein
MPVTKTDGKTQIKKPPISSKLTVYDRATGEAHEKWPIDAHESVAGGAYSFDRSDVGKAQAPASAETADTKETAPDYSALTKDELVALAVGQGKTANKRMSVANLIALVEDEK